METLWLKSLNLPHCQICRIADISEMTLTRYLTEYNNGGIEKSEEIKFYKPKSELIDFEGTIKEYFTKNPPSTIKEAAFRIKKLTGIERKLSQTAKYIKSIGMKLRKVATIPAKADIEKQKEFIENKLKPK